MQINIYFGHENPKRMYFITFPYVSAFSMRIDVFKLIDLGITGSNRTSLLAATAAAFTRQKYNRNVKESIFIIICLNNNKNILNIDVSNRTLHIHSKISKIHKNIEYASFNPLPERKQTVPRLKLCCNW